MDYPMSIANSCCAVWVIPTWSNPPPGGISCEPTGPLTGIEHKSGRKWNSFWQHLDVEATLGRITRDAADQAFALFLAAYQSCRPVSEQELEAIPYLSLGFWLFYMSFHTTHDQFYPFIQPAHLKLRLDLIQQLMTRNWSEPYPAPAI